MRSGAVKLFALVLLLQGCAALFGWDIHAPGILSADGAARIRPVPERVALYFGPELVRYESRARGSRTADPTTFHAGEAFAPILIEAFQSGFEEFVMMETDPTADILEQYGIKYLAVVRIRDFQNRMTWKGQALTLRTETAVLDSHLQPLARFESRGTSDAEKVFAKKGGPEVNLNAALENNAIGILQYLQDAIRSGQWKSGGSA